MQNECSVSKLENDIRSVVNVCDAVVRAVRQRTRVKDGAGKRSKGVDGAAATPTA